MAKKISYDSCVCCCYTSSNKILKSKEAEGNSKLPLTFTERVKIRKGSLKTSVCCLSVSFLSASVHDKELPASFIVRLLWSLKKTTRFFLPIVFLSRSEERRRKSEWRVQKSRHPKDKDREEVWNRARKERNGELHCRWIRILSFHEFLWKNFFLHSVWDLMHHNHHHLFMSVSFSPPWGSQGIIKEKNWNLLEWM